MPRVYTSFAMDTTCVLSWGRPPRRAPKELLRQGRAAARERGVDVERASTEEDPLHHRAPGLHHRRGRGRGEGRDLSGPVPATPPGEGEPPEAVGYEPDGDWGMRTNTTSTSGLSRQELLRLRPARHGPGPRPRRRPGPGGGPDRSGGTFRPRTPMSWRQPRPHRRRTRRPACRSGDLLADRHYSYKKPERWADQLVERGIKQVVDLHKNDQGFRDYQRAPSSPPAGCTAPPPPTRSARSSTPGQARDQAGKEGASPRPSRIRLPVRDAPGGSQGRASASAVPALNGTVGCGHSARAPSKSR